MTKRYLGNIITQNPTAPVGTARPSTLGSAKGVWSLNEALTYQKAGQWPYPVYAPDAPTIGTATAGNAAATVSFTAPAEDGGLNITQYTATSNPGSITGTASSSPVTVTGLTNDVTYTFTVTATNAAGTSPFSGSSNSVSPVVPFIGLFAGGLSASSSAVNIESININTTGNASDFGNLSIKRSDVPAGMGSSTRAVFASGNTGEPSFWTSSMDYVTFSSAGNASNFGNISTGAKFMAGLSNSTRGLMHLGNVQSGANPSNTIEYITIASTGNSSNFGDITVFIQNRSGCASTTRGVFAGGDSEDIIDYVTIASTGNALDFGDLTENGYRLAGCSSSTRGVFAGGRRNFSAVSNKIEYITIASTGNGTDFGDLISATDWMAGCSSSTRGVFAGGEISGSLTNTIQYITIASTGNGTDFGDLTEATDEMAGTSNCHGGI